MLKRIIRHIMDLFKDKTKPIDKYHHRLWGEPEFKEK